MIVPRQIPKETKTMLLAMSLITSIAQNWVGQAARAASALQRKVR
jgi:hypothetical protein